MRRREPHLCGRHARIHNETTSAGKGGRTVIDDAMAERMVACGWLAASAAGLFMLVAGDSWLGTSPIMWVYIGGAAICSRLAYGIYRRSRMCAVLVLVNHFLRSREPLCPRARRAADGDSGHARARRALCARRDRHLRASRTPALAGGVARGAYWLTCGSKPTKLILSPARMPWRAQNPPLTSST